jgi:phosphatidylglycerol---prolipoprotein diacylglyceryl transferase
MISSSGYSVAILLAMLVALGLGLWQSSELQLPRFKTLFAMILAAASSVPGARLWYAVTHPQLMAAGSIGLFDVQPTGLSLQGGVLLAAAVGALACRCLRLPVLPVAYAVTPGTLAGISVMKLGCLLRGCCFGTPTDLPWGMRFPVESPAGLRQLEVAPWTILTGSVAIHPVQLYEALGYVLIAGLLLRIPVSFPSPIRPLLGFAAVSAIHGSCLLLRDIPDSSRWALQLGITVDALVFVGSGVWLTQLGMAMRSHGSRTP